MINIVSYMFRAAANAIERDVPTIEIDEKD